MLHHMDNIGIVRIVLLILALVSFLRCQVPVPSRINWIALGLAFWMLALILRSLVPIAASV